MTRILFIITGLPGSGKTTLARDLVDDEHVCEADKFRIVDGTYVFDPETNADAHYQCEATVAEKMAARVSRIAVSNVFTRPEYIEPYLRLAAHHGYRVRIFNLGSAGLTDEELAERNIHDVPVEQITRMRTMSDRLPYAQAVSHPVPPSYVARYWTKYAGLFGEGNDAV